MSWLRRLRGRNSEGPPPRSLEERAGVAFGDRVRILASDVTTALDLAGKTGLVIGLTTPSLGYADDLIGEPIDDVAVSVQVDADLVRWFSAELVELVDHGAGTTMAIGSSTFVRSDDGEWLPTNQSMKRPG